MPGTPAQQWSRPPAPEPSIADLLSGGDPRTLRNVDEVVGKVLAAPERLDELIGSVLDSPDEVLRMRAADALEKVCRAQPPLLQPHVSLLLATCRESASRRWSGTWPRCSARSGSRRRNAAGPPGS